MKRDDEVSEFESRLSVEVSLAIAIDRARGVVEPLSHYLQRFPGTDELVAREYLRIIDEDAEPPSDDLTRDDAEAIGPYRIEAEIGRGGQGIVYRARDTRVRRTVALKVLDRTVIDADDALVRFKREAEIGARLDHPGIATIYDVGRDVERTWIAMRYVEGESLARRLNERTSPPDREETVKIVRFFAKTARILHVAHEAQVIHRDIKPANIMIGPDGDPVLLDFGLARDVNDVDVSLTMTGDVFGTPGYLAPERLSGARRTPDRALDVYALGVSLYVAVTGRLPFSGTTVEELQRAIRESDPPDPRRTNSAVSADLRILIDTCLEKSPDRRYRTAAALADDLERVANGEAIAARPAGFWRRVSRTIRRNPLTSTVAAAIFVTLSVALVVTLTFLDSEKTLRRVAEDREMRLIRLADARQARRLLEAESKDLWPIDHSLVARADTWLSELDSLLSRRKLHEETFASLERSDARSDVAESAEGSEWIKEVLKGLFEDLDRLSAASDSVRARLLRAQTHDDRCLVAPAEAWNAARQAIAIDPRFRGVDLEPQTGLIPLGTDASSGLQTFLVAESGEPPIIDASGGSMRVTEKTGIVLVLLPGGTFYMGSQNRDRDDDNFDPMAEAQEQPVHAVTLDPFFLSKFEMTQAQFMAYSNGVNPSTHSPGSKVDFGYSTESRLLTWPVESVDWKQIVEALRRAGLRLPTEAEWEFGCRAGDEASFSIGPELEDINGRCNIAGQESRTDIASKGATRDASVLLAPVDSYASNRFGMYNVHGNVFEWCADALVHYHAAEARAGDGLRAENNAAMTRVVRGGSYLFGAKLARSAARSYAAESFRSKDLGARPARSLETTKVQR